eukprot:11216750-Lingulodinium_polyedra.AAC.1
MEGVSSIWPGCNTCADGQTQGARLQHGGVRPGVKVDVALASIRGAIIWGVAAGSGIARAKNNAG